MQHQDRSAVTAIKENLLKPTRRRSDRWARTVSNRRPLVCKAAVQRLHRLSECQWCRYVLVANPSCVTASTASRLVVARLGTFLAHAGV